MRGYRLYFVAVFAAFILLPATAAHAGPEPLFRPAAAQDTTAVRERSEQCVWCHVVGAADVYGGDLGRYERASDRAHTADLTPCLACHVEHGEQGMGGAVARAMLRIRPYQRELVDDLAGGDDSAVTNGTASAEGWDARTIQLTAFCSSCHPMYSDAAVAVPGDRRPRTHHPQRLASDAYRTTQYGTQRVAAAPSIGCTSCHGAGAGDGSFPHSTPDAAAFLLVAADAAGEPTGADVATANGVCLRCHRWSDAGGGRGVGEDW